jgi:hypothetical protein
MLTAEQIIEYMQLVIAEDRLAGNSAGLRNTQLAAGFLMAAANYAGEKDIAFRFRVLAAEAANKNEELGGRD